MRFLQEGGYLVVLTDTFVGSWRTGSVLGKTVPLPRGPVWLAERTGKPIVPFMVTPERRRWRLWIGDPISPTQESVVAAPEACLRKAPGICERTIADGWRRAPDADEGA